MFTPPSPSLNVKGQMITQPFLQRQTNTDEGAELLMYHCSGGICGFCSLTDLSKIVVALSFTQSDAEVYRNQRKGSQFCRGLGGGQFWPIGEGVE